VAAIAERKSIASNFVFSLGCDFSPIPNHPSDGHGYFGVFRVGMMQSGGSALYLFVGR